MTCPGCGAEVPAGAAFCPACGRRLGEPHEPERPVRCPPPVELPVVNVRIVDSPGRGCVSCFTWSVTAFMLVLIIAWLAASC